MRSVTSIGFGLLRGPDHKNLFLRAFAIMLLSVGLLTTTSAMAQVDNLKFGYPGGEAGDWGGQNGAIIGPADGTCANMGAVGKVNTVHSFGFDLPADATITDVTAYIEAAEGSTQAVATVLSDQAVLAPYSLLGTAVQFDIVGQGASCSDTFVTVVGGGLAFWGSPVITPAIVNSAAFGMVYTKLETSSIKVDAVCMEIGYQTPAGPAVVDSCVALPTDVNSITVTKNVVGASLTDWLFTGDLGLITLPPLGGFQVFTPVVDGTYTITETAKAGWTVTSECLIDGIIVSSGAASVSVDVAGTQAANCIFTNTLNTGTFTVSKDFSDNNAASVVMSLTCSSGTVVTNDLAATEAAPAVFDVISFEPGATCTATEAATPGYTQDITACQAGGLLADGGACAMVNTLNTGSFTVSKDFSDNNTASVVMTLACSEGTITANDLPATEAAPAVFEITGAEPGATCTATEAATPGYTQNIIACQAGGLLADGGACTMVNTLNAGSFTVLKDFSDDSTANVVMSLTCSSGTVTVNDLPATEAAPAVFEVTGTEPGATCTATEAATPGYTQDITACQAEGLLADGGDCTMVNTRDPGTFTVSKDFSDDSTASVDMTLTCSEGTVTVPTLPATEAAPAVFDVTGAEPGATCTATEAATPGYTQDDTACQAEGLLADGGACTMVNTLGTGSFTVSKDFSDDSTASVVMTLACSEGTITANDLPATEAAPAVFEVTGTEPGATCTATEAATPGYTQDDTACQADDLLADGGVCTMVNTLEPPVPVAPPAVAIPTLDWRGLLALIMIMLFTGLYLRPGVMRR
jgi:hypothetical protein